MLMSSQYPRKIKEAAFHIQWMEIEIWSKGEVKDIMVIGVFFDQP